MRKFGIFTAAFITLMLAAGFWAKSGYTQIDWNNDEELSDFTAICCNKEDFEVISDDDETTGDVSTGDEASYSADSEEGTDVDSDGEEASEGADSGDEITGVDSDGQQYIEIYVPATESDDSIAESGYTRVDSDGNQYIEIIVPSNNDDESEDKTDTDTDTDTEDLRKELEDALSGADYVLKVSCDGNTAVSFGMTIQDVTVIETYTGLQSLDGESIRLVSSSEKICFGELWDNNSTIGGYANLMKEGEEYLLFCNDIGSQNMYREVSLLSYFALSDLDNIIPDSDDTTYATLKNNEFFAADQESLDILLDIKKTMLDSYL